MNAAKLESKRVEEMIAEGRDVKQPEPQVLSGDSGRGQSSKAARATGTAWR